jgi:hypothetical protein
MVLLCEDTQHETCLRRFLSAMGWEPRAMRVEKAPAGQGSAEQFVRQQFPRELKAHRSRHVNQVLVTMWDGDRHGVKARVEQLNEACRTAGVPVPQPEERVAVFVPTWRIETWFAYLDGETVDEAKSDYPRLSRARDCQRHVDHMANMCRAGALRDPSPPSLGLACSEYTRRLQTDSS